MMFRALGTMHRDQMGRAARENRLPASDQREPPGVSAHMATTLPPGSATVPASASNGDNGVVRPGHSAAAAAAKLRETLSSPENGTDHDQLRDKARSLVDQPPNPSLNVHEWLIGRLAALEDEQRTRWQKILDLVRGR